MWSSMTEQLPSNYAAGLLHLGIREPELSHHTSCTILMLPGVCVKFFLYTFVEIGGKESAARQKSVRRNLRAALLPFGTVGKYV
jgi:hypothetical protein